MAYQLNDDESLASNFQTSAVRVATADNIGIWIYANNVTDNTGSFVVQVRPWRDDNTFGEWVTLTLSADLILSNADEDFFVNLNQLPNCQVRVSFTAAGGTPDGDCDIWISGTGA